MARVRVHAETAWEEFSGKKARGGSESGFSGRSGEGGSGELVHAETVRERARSGLKIGLARKRRRVSSQGEVARVA